MTKEELLYSADYDFKRTVDLLVSKGNDYSTDDALSNFKQVGAICGISPAKAALVLIAVKVARLGVLLSGVEPKNESIIDSVDDLRTYSFLLNALVKEEMNNGLSQPTQG